ncbi:MAG: hypothetical protein LUG94_06890, partial [Ruminococcus sp.]|nr:hypothetical protein [Ruminococcus sp.]
TGIYGCGTYTSYSREIAINYAQKADKTNNNNGDISVFKMIIGEDMIFANYEELKKEFDSLQSTASRLNKLDELSNYEFFFRDIGVYATLKGYDGIKLNNYNGYNHIIILNRSKLIVINGEEDISV